MSKASIPTTTFRLKFLTNYESIFAGVKKRIPNTHRDFLSNDFLSKDACCCAFSGTRCEVSANRRGKFFRRCPSRSTGALSVGFLRLLGPSPMAPKNPNPDLRRELSQATKLPCRGRHAHTVGRLCALFFALENAGEERKTRGKRERESRYTQRHDYFS